MVISKQPYEKNIANRIWRTNHPLFKRDDREQCVYFAQDCKDVWRHKCNCLFLGLSLENDNTNVI